MCCCYVLSCAKSIWTAGGVKFTHESVDGEKPILCDQHMLYCVMKKQFFNQAKRAASYSLVFFPRPGFLLASVR